MFPVCDHISQRIYSFLFSKEKCFWYLISISCTGFLLKGIFMDFFVLKPTVSSRTELALSEVRFPDILVCLEIGFDQKKLEDYGYTSSYWYYQGTNNQRNFIGWNGDDGNDPIQRVSNKMFLTERYQIEFKDFKYVER